MSKVQVSVNHENYPDVVVVVLSCSTKLYLQSIVIKGKKKNMKQNHVTVHCEFNTQNSHFLVKYSQRSRLKVHVN